MSYKVLVPFTKYVFCTSEWTLCENLCKHQVFFLTCINFIKKIIFNIVGHDMNLIVKVLPPVYLFVLIFDKILKYA
jgi:hypothetical protein